MFTPDAGLYQRSRGEIDWLMEEAEPHRVPIVLTDAAYEASVVWVPV